MDQTIHLQNILSYAHQEALRLGNSEVMPDHLVLGILRLAEGKAFELLMQAGMSPVEVKRAIEERLMQPQPVSEVKGLSRTAERIMRLLPLECSVYRTSVCGSAHLLMAILRERINFPAMFLEQQFGIDYECIEQIFPKPLPTEPENSDAPESPESPDDSDSPDMPDLPESPSESMPFSPFENDSPIRFIFHRASPQGKKSTSPHGTPSLDKYGRDLTEQAQKGELDPVEGRQQEIARLTQILGRRKKNNPILIGEPGVGKSAIVEGLALRIVANQVAGLEGKRIVALDMASMVAGTTYRGQFEERMKTVLSELRKHPEVILFIDEIHTLIGAGNAQGALDAANILKPALARGEIQCIGATTTAEYRTSIEKDGALERRFQKVLIQPTSKSDTFSILSRLSQTYGLYHHVTYTTEALQACVELTDRYITDRSFPDKAIDAMDEAGAMIRSTAPQTKHPAKVTEETVQKVVSRMSGIPVQRVARAENEQLRRLPDVLSRSVIGQDKAVAAVAKAIQRSRLGLRDPHKPIGVFFFLGPTGVGKTHLAQCLAEELFGTRKAIIRFDMSEYMEKHSVSLLVGAPPGYVAHEDGGKLTEAVRRQPYSIVLFDEIEKAHPDIFNVLLQVMDEGRLTDRQGHEVDFKNTIIILTSNVGTRQLADFGAGVGFGAEEMSQQTTDQTLMKALQRTFPPEFVNRLDDVVIFHHLTKDSLAQILRVELCPLRVRLKAMGYDMHVSSATRQKILQAGMDPRYGARPLKRAIQTYLEDPLTERLLTNRPEPGKITL